jgi:hypothetical protein
MLPFLFPVEALALDCETLDPEICATTEAIAASLNDQAGGDLVTDASPRRLQPLTIHRRLERTAERLMARGCTLEGWSAGLAASGDWEGVYTEDAAAGTWDGTYDLETRTLLGTWTTLADSGTAGTRFSIFDKQGVAIADLGPDRVIGGYWTRRRGGSFAFAMLHASCPDPFAAADGAVRGTPNAAPPDCPEVELSSDTPVALAELGITSAAGDPLAPLGVRLIDGDGTPRLSTASPPDALELFDLRPLLDARGVALPRLEVVVPDGAGEPSTCSFPIAPPDRIVCRPRLTRTVFDREVPLPLDLEGDCVALDDDPSALDVVALEPEGSGPIVVEETPDGELRVRGSGPGTQVLKATPRNGDPIRFTITFSDTWGLVQGETNEVPEDGGNIAIAPLLDQIPGDDPLAPIAVELIGPDLSSITASDVVGDELVVPKAPVEDQGEAVVTPKLLLTVQRGENVEVHRFDVPVNRAPYCRADGPLPVDAGQLRVPLDWCIDPEGEPLEVLSVQRAEDGAEVPFSLEDEHLVFAAAGNGDPIRFTLDFRDSFLNRPVVPPTIGTGTFTITSRDTFDAL